MNLQLAPMSLDEAPAIPSADDALTQLLSNAALSNETEILDALAARRVDLNLSTKELERAAKLCKSHYQKCCGPQRLRSPSLSTVTKLMRAMGLSLVFLIDPQKMHGPLPKRNEAKVRRQRKERQPLLRKMLRQAAQPKWRGVEAKAFIKAAMEKP